MNGAKEGVAKNFLKTKQIARSITIMVLNSFFYSEDTGDVVCLDYVGGRVEFYQG